MIVIKRLLSLIIAAAMLISSCSFREEEGSDNQDAELIINENNTVFKLVAEESDILLPICNIPQSLADSLSCVYESLFDFDESFNKIPILATNCVRSGKYQYKVDLKDGVLWHDGSEFTSSDVIYTVNVLKKGESVYSPLVEKITQVDVINKHKLLFTLSEPTVNFEALLTFPIVKRNTPTDKYTDPNGTGPYEFKEKKNNTLFFVKNSKWHGTEASDKTVTVTLLKDKQSAVYAFEANEADVIGSSLIDLTKNTPKGKVSVQDYISNNLTFLGMNDAEGILSLSEMRKAVAYLIDKNQIIRNDVYGRGEAADVPIYPKAWFFSDDFGNIEISGSGDYLDKVLTDNGWYIKNGIYTKDFGGYETELTLSVLVNSDNEEKMNIAESVAAMLTENGIIVKVKAVPYERYLSKIKDKDFSMFIGETAMPKNMDPTNLVKSGDNYFSYSSEEMDGIIDRLTSATESEEIKSCYGEFFKLFSEDMPFVPLFFRKNSFVYNSRLSGFGMPNYFNTYRNIENWYFSQKVELNNQ